MLPRARRGSRCSGRIPQPGHHPRIADRLAAQQVRGDAVGVDGGGDQPLRRLSMQQSPTGGRCNGVERATYQRMSKSQSPPQLEQGLGGERVTQPGDIADVEAGRARR